MRKNILLLFVASLLLAGCGGNNPGPTGSAGANGEFSFNMYWGADTRSLEIDAWSVRITASREDGAGTPVSMVVNRPDNIDTPQTVTLPGRFRVGTHRIDFKVFSEPNATGNEIGLGGMSRRLVPNSRNAVRVNIGVSRGLTLARGDVARELEAGVPFTVRFDTRPSFDGGGSPVENEVNILPGSDIGLDLNGGIRPTKLGSDLFRVDRPGYYSFQFQLDGRVISDRRTVVRGAPIPGPDPLAASPWPTSEGPATRDRTAPTSCPVTLGTPQVSQENFFWGPVDNPQMAVLASGDVVVAAEANNLFRVALFAGDLSTLRWSISLPTAQTPFIQVAALRNGLILVEDRTTTRTLDASTGQVDWQIARGTFDLLPSAFYQNYLVNSSSFVSLGSGQTAFLGPSGTTFVLADGTAITWFGLTHLSSPEARYDELRGGNIADVANGIILSPSRVFSYRDLTRIAIPFQPVVGLVPGQPSEWIGYGSGRHVVLRSSNRSLIRTMKSGTRAGHQIAFQNRVLAAIADNGNPVAFNLDTGDEFWRADAQVVALAAGANRLYALRTDGRLMMIGP